MGGSELGLLVAVFLACAVEAVEALTIVLAVGLERDMRSALAGAAAALLTLAALTTLLGPAIRSLPLGALRVIVGGLLLVFGLQWLRKAILRGAGRKALHDEAAAFVAHSARARAAGRQPLRGLDGYALVVAAKGVLLEGLEVVFIVLTFGANQRDLTGAALAATLAVVLVGGLGVALRAPLARVPENTLKLGVGVLLCAFGMFWATEGAGAHWPGNDAALLVLVPATAAVALALTRMLRAPVLSP